MVDYPIGDMIAERVKAMAARLKELQAIKKTRI